MPAYTCGFLAPVPFLYAAFRTRTRKLWLIAAAYTSVWLAMWVLFGISPDEGSDAAAAVAVALVFGLAVVGTIHALEIRRSAPARAEPPPKEVVAPAGAAVVDDGADDHAHLRAALTSLKSYVAGHAHSYPPACGPLLTEVVGYLDQVVSLVEQGGHADKELRFVHAMLTDYIPTSINTYVRLPRQYALTHRNPDGRTPADELELQLRLLRDSARAAVTSLYDDDSLRLQEQSAFLSAKFGTSELDLP